MTRRFLQAAFTLLLVVLAAFTAAPTSASTDTAGDEVASLARRAVELTNQERLNAGLNPLVWNDQLAASATAYAQKMAAEGFFAHTSSDGSTPVERARRAGYPTYGWGGLYVGENLARGYNTAESVVPAWMASESHKQNLLLPKYREIGIGIAVAPNGTRYWAQEFGSRPMVLPVFINGGAGSTDSPAVSLTLTDEQVSPWGSLAAITGMMVSNRPDFSGARWEPFAKAKTWTLAGQPGVDTVYVRLQDAAGQLVDSSSQIQYFGRVALSTEQEGLPDAEVAGEPAPESPPTPPAEE